MMYLCRKLSKNQLVWVNLNYQSMCPTCDSPTFMYEKGRGGWVTCSLSRLSLIYTGGKSCLMRAFLYQIHQKQRKVQMVSYQHRPMLCYVCYVSCFCLYPDILRCFSPNSSETWLARLEMMTMWSLAWGLRFRHMYWISHLKTWPNKLQPHLWAAPLCLIRSFNYLSRRQIRGFMKVHISGGVAVHLKSSFSHLFIQLHWPQLLRILFYWVWSIQPP